MSAVPKLTKGWPKLKTVAATRVVAMIKRFMVFSFLVVAGHLLFAAMTSLHHPATATTRRRTAKKCQLC
jgi:hypothetical protein